MSQLEQYDYDLPRQLIAQEQLASRSDARLMHVHRASGQIEHHHVRDLPELLRAEDALVLNDSRVIPARLIGYRTRTEGRWRGLFLRSDPETGVWEVLSRTRGKLATGETITVQDRDARDGMRLEIVARTDEGHLLVLPRPLDPAADPPPDREPGDWLDRFGRIPLPPYIREGQMMDADVANYQTVFAKHRGSVAAPTAGLHFTDSLLEQIRGGQTAVAQVTLHVGLGTFRPIEASRLEDHRMHSEWGRITAESCDVINRRRSAGGRCVAVGTTCVRVLETAAAEGRGELRPWTGTTELFIKPPHDFLAVDALMTNFHLPKSSLLVLVSAFAGRDLIMHAYETAIRNEYRFYSYGDAMLIT